MANGVPESTDRVLELPVQVIAVASSARHADGANRRQHPRMPVGLWASCQIDGAMSQQALGDLSISGLYLRTNVAPRIGARVRIVLGLPYISGQRVCSLAGSIIWIDRDGDTVRGAGVRFDHETDSADHDLLYGFLSLWGVPDPTKHVPPTPQAE